METKFLHGLLKIQKRQISFMSYVTKASYAENVTKYESYVHVSSAEAPRHKDGNRRGD